MRWAVLCLLIPVLTACATMDTDVGTSGPSSPFQTSMPEKPDEPEMAAETVESSPVPPAPSPSRTSRVHEQERALWNDEAFKKRFMESYLSETEIEPRVTLVERDKMQEMLELMGAGKLDEAAGLLEKNRGDSANALFDFTLANIRYQQERFDEAVTAYKIAIEKYPMFRRAWQGLGQACFRLGDFKNVVPALGRVVALGGGDGFTYGLLGIACSNVGNHLSAESAYRMATLLDPGRLDWKMYLAESLFKQERFADVVALSKNLIDEHPNRARLWLIQANAYVGLGQPLRAAENFELVDRLGQSTAESLNLLGNIYINEKHFELATNAYIRALEKDPQGNTRRAILAARELAARGALGETRQLVDRIEALHGDRLEKDDGIDLLRLRARVAVAEGAGEEEARVLEKIIELDPLDGEALILLGQYTDRTGNPEKAVFYYERAAGLEAFEADAKVRHAQLLVGQGKYAEALPLLRRAQKLKPRENIQAFLEQVERVARAR